MSGRAALSRRTRLARAAILAGLLVAVAGCTQPGTQAPGPEAARLSHATGDISLACGYAEELTAFGGPHPAGLAAQETTALFGAQLLLKVWSRNPRWIYQGESIGGVVDDSISLLGTCGLAGAQRFLQRAVSRSGP